MLCLAEVTAAFLFPARRIGRLYRHFLSTNIQFCVSTPSKRKGWLCTTCKARDFRRTTKGLQEPVPTQTFGLRPVAPGWDPASSSEERRYERSSRSCSNGPGGTQAAGPKRLRGYKRYSEPKEPVEDAPPHWRREHIIVRVAIVFSQGLSARRGRKTRIGFKGAADRVYGRLSS